MRNTHIFIAPDNSWFLGWFQDPGIVRKHMIFDQATSGSSASRSEAITHGYKQWAELAAVGLIEDSVPMRTGDQFERVVLMNVKVLGFGK